MFCPGCGRKIPDDSEVCPYCGTRFSLKSETNEDEIDKSVQISDRDSIMKRLKKVFKTGEKDPIVAVGLSFFIPGRGQFYNGEYLKGIIIIFLIILDVIIFRDHPYIYTAIFLVIWIYSLIDAYVTAKKIMNTLKW